MSGILLAKERIMDTVLTQEGRRQLSEGELRPAFISFTDGQTIYQVDTIVSGSSWDQSRRFILEAPSFLPQDQITFEVDDSGLIQAFPISGSTRLTVLQGQILSSSSGTSSVPLTGSAFTTNSETLFNDALNSFLQMQILQSPDASDDTERQFLVGPTGARFTVTKDRPIKNKMRRDGFPINQLESLFFDKKLSHIQNYQFLPPVNSPTFNSNEATALGTYVDYNQAPMESYEDLYNQELKPLIDMGYSQTFRFTETSNQNNIFCQMFESSKEGKLAKLIAIDFGEFDSKDDSGTKHVFFIGKLFEDDYGMETFVNLFTLIFEN